jgi:hypothetical protein
VRDQRFHSVYSALFRLYATTHKQLRDSLQPEQEEPSEEFREQRLRKRNPSEEQPTIPKKAAGTTGSLGNPSVRAAPQLRRLVAGFPPRRPGSGHVGFCDGQNWRWSRFSLRTSVSPANLHSICFSTIIFTITRGWHNRPGVAAVLIASQTKYKKVI